MLTEKSLIYNEKPLSSNINLQNSAKKSSPTKKPFKNEVSLIKENIDNGFKEDILKKYEGEIAKNKEKLKEKVIKESKLLDEINQMRLKMVPLLDKIHYLEENSDKNTDLAPLQLKIDDLSSEKLVLLDKIEEFQKELLKRDEIFKEWNEVVDQLDTKLSNVNSLNKVLKDKNQVLTDKEDAFLKEKEVFLKEKEVYIKEIDSLQRRIYEIEAINKEKAGENESLLIKQNSLILAHKQALEAQIGDFQCKNEGFLKEKSVLQEKLEISVKKNGFLTNRIYELNKEIELLKENPQSFVKEEYLGIRPSNKRKSFELLNDNLTLKLNNLEKIFKNDVKKAENIHSKGISQEKEKKFFISKPKNDKKEEFRSISARREREYPNQTGNMKKQMKNEFQSDFLKRFKQVISQLETRLDNISIEEKKS